MVDNTRIYKTYTPTVSFADREDYRPKKSDRQHYNPYSPLAMQRSRHGLKLKDNSYTVGYNVKVERYDYAFASDLDLAASSHLQRGFKVDENTMSLWRSYLSGKL